MELHVLPDSIQVFIYGLMGVSVLSGAEYSSRRRSIPIQGIVVALMSFVITALAVEGVCGIILYLKERGVFSSAPLSASSPVCASVRHTNFRLIRYDRLGMSRPAPGQYETIYSTIEKQTGTGEERLLKKTNHVTYHIDSLSRRITPFINYQPTGKYALFLGCSFTYGESVSDTSTLPYFFGKQTGYHPYNYGVSGHSPAHMLALLQSTNLRSQIAEKNGVAFYTYIEDHLARSMPNTKWINKSNGYLPYVDPVTLTVDGSYAQKHPIRLSLIRWLYKSNVVKLFNIDFPRRYNSSDYQRFVAIVRKSKERYQQQFGNDNFYVVVFPAYPLNPELRRLFIDNHLKLIDYGDLPAWKTAYDSMHPNEEAYRQVATKLAQDLPGETAYYTATRQHPIK